MEFINKPKALQNIPTNLQLKPPKYLDYSHIKTKKLVMEAWKGGEIYNIYEGLWEKHYKIKDLEGHLDVL